jgi:hypothetical protein
LAVGRGHVDVIVEEGQVALVAAEESRVMLPGQVGGSAVAEVGELVALAPENPENRSILATYEYNGVDVP